MGKNYKRTLIACYLGFITQAITANFAPLLFLKFHKDYAIPLGKIAMISTMFFLTQLIVDVLCAKYVDRIGYRKSVVASEVCSVAGLVGLAFLPEEMIRDLIRQGQLISVPIKEKIPKRNVCMIYDEKRPTGAAVQKLKSILML